MKERIMKKGIIIVLLILQLFQLVGNFFYVEAAIKEGDVINLKGDHECDSLLEYWMEDYQKWSYKVVWYVYYVDNEDGKKYPAFCVEPAKEGVGTGYDSYDTTLRRESDNRIWRILDKGYMGSIYKDWNLECDDDFYSANKIALHSLIEGIAPKDKYILGTRSVDGNTIEEIRRRGAKVLEVAQTLYEYGINGTDTYKSPKVSISKQENSKIETIQNTNYYIQNYQVTANKSLKTYEVEIQNFPTGTKILNLQNQEQTIHSNNSFKIAIPINQIKYDIKGHIKIKNAYIKTNPIFYCNSSIEKAQNYVTYMNGYETDSTSTTLTIKADNCNLSIMKIDKETRNPIANVTFEIKDKQGNKLEEVTTNEKGITGVKNLYPQEILIKEIKVPELYILSNEEKEVKLEWGKTSSITFENERKRGNLKIIKLDADDNKTLLEKVEFELLDSKGNFIKKLITDKNGEANINDLEIGKYYLKEIKAQNKYLLNEELIEVEVKNEETITLNITNEKIKGKIKINKISEDDNKRNGKPKGSPIENVVFEIRKEDGEVVETITTNEDGIAESKELEKGKYIIREIKSHQDYEIIEKEFEIEILEHQKTEEITITNLSKEPDPPKLPRTGF